MTASLIHLPTSLDIEGLEACDESDAMIERVRLFFPNGYGVSVIRGRRGTAFERILPPEGAVLGTNGELTYETSVTSDVVRFRNSDDMVEFIREVAALPMEIENQHLLTD